ncbi:MAG: hypothetical protein ABI185_00215 [Ginsengibacter sp.]
MKILATIFLALILGTSSGQSFNYPSIKQKGNSIHDFVPKGWIILKSTKGDLNNDQYNDIAFVLQHRDSVSLSKDEDGISDTVITQPRILIIAFFNNVKKQYDLVEQSNSFILYYDNPSMDEPFQNISIANQILKINFSIFYNMGSWQTSTNSYKFRFNDNEFKLIGADYNSTMRNTGETEDRSYNFLTKKVRVITGNIENNKRKTKWKPVDAKKLKTFKTFTQPFTWEVEKDFFI